MMGENNFFKAYKVAPKETGLFWNHNRSLLSPWISDSLIQSVNVAPNVNIYLELRVYKLWFQFFNALDEI